MNPNFYKTQIEHMPFGYAYHKIICDSDGIPIDYEFIEVNNAFEKLTGLRAKDIIGEKVTVILPGIRTGKLDWVKKYGEIALGEEEQDFDAYSEQLGLYYRIHAYSDRKFYFTTVFSYLPTNDFQLLYDNMQSGAAIYEVMNDGKYGRDYIIKNFNKKSLEIEGKTIDEIVGKSLYDLRPKIDEFGLIEVFRDVWKTGIPQKFPSKEYIDENYQNYYENTIFRLDKNIIVAMYSDVTDIMRAQKELEKSRDEILSNQSILKETEKLAHIGSWKINTDTREMFWSDELFRICGYEPGAFNPTWEKTLMLIHEKDKKVFMEAYEKSKKGTAHGDFEFRIIRPDGSVRWVLLQGSIMDNGKHLTGSILDITRKKKDTEKILQDMRELKIAEMKINESEKKYHAMFDYAALGICNTSPTGKILEANKRFCDILGYTQEEITKMTFSDFTHPDDITKSQDLLQKLLKGQDIHASKRYIRKDGQIVYANISSSMIMNSQNQPVYTVTTLEDTTEIRMLEQANKQMEANMIEKQRLQSIGTLASGVAHEINNPINGIMNYGQLILDREKTDSKILDYAYEIIHESNRISEIVKNLLNFSRQNKQEHSYANIEDIVSQTLSLINTVFRHDQIILKINIPEGLSPIKCRSQQIQQIIMNILTNARDSLNEKYEGYNENKIIKLSCQQIEKDQQGWLRIAIEDFGTGIDKDVVGRVFDPFFSTKKKDRGTGLGLSISYGLVKDHHGEISIETKVDEFTRFIIDLPVENDWQLISDC